ncbi:Uncharacterised protein [Yersinia enterocolitica]|nr:Uncharacterised protein [Yersinia enterocolitica]
MMKNSIQSYLRPFNPHPVGLHYLYAHIITGSVTGYFRGILEASP